MKTILDLNGSWTLYLAPNAWVTSNAFTASAEQALSQSPCIRIPAQVPGNFELELQKAGLLPTDLFYGTNPLLIQKEENKHLWYVKRFSLSSLPAEEMLFRFEGIDTFAEIYLNGTLIGECDNMLVEHEYPAKGLRIGENELLVHIHPTAIRAREYEGGILYRAMKYNGDSLYVRKAPYMFGWDIMPRVVSGGIWRSVSLIQKPRNRLTDYYLAVSLLDLEKNMAQLSGYLHLHTDEDFLSDFEAVVCGRCRDSSFEKRIRFFSANTHFSITFSDFYLWWPRHAGEQNLYDTEIRLYRNGELCDTVSFRMGLRTVHLNRTSVIDENGNGRFEFFINGKKIFILGTNWVPLDAFPSQNEKRLSKALALTEEIGCNMIRLWGGNVYESDAFYDFCDEHGILLWQDFIMGCAYYPQDGRFRNALRSEAIAVIKRLRHHPSLVLWAGDNECDSCSRGHYRNGERVDPTKNVLTRKILSDALEIHDGFRPYLPSSPYFDEVATQTGLRPPEDHLWGPRNYFKSDYYQSATARFASETGFHGCPSPASLKTYISPEQLWPSLEENGRPQKDWLVHAASMETEDIGPFEYRIALMLQQVVELFGNEAPQSYEEFRASRNDPQHALYLLNTVQRLFGDSQNILYDFARASQIFQAEGLKYMIERFRIRKETHGGLIWWNLLDGWHQISDAIVDYSFTKKLAYDYVANSQQPVCLMFDEPKDGTISLIAVNDLPQEKTLTYSVVRFSDQREVCQGNVHLDADGIAQLTSLPVTESEQEFYLIKWQDENGHIGRNHYVTNIRGIPYRTYLSFLADTQIGHFEGFSKGESL